MTSIDEHCFQTDEIGDVLADTYLPAEFVTFELTQSEVAP
jgi:hypothetical protein